MLISIPDGDGFTALLILAVLCVGFILGYISNKGGGSK